MNKNTLWAIGATLIILGVITRGLASAQRRTAALRKQHDLDVRKPGESVRPEPHLEKHLGRYANGAIVLGLVVIGASFFASA